jgi:hypothetical protein
MTAPRNPDRILEAFLTDGPMELPDRAFDAVRRDIHSTRQRVVFGPWKEPSVLTLSRLATAAAVIVAVAFAWINIRPSISGPGSPTPTPAITAGPSASPAIINNQGALLPGRYTFDYVNAAGSEGATGPWITITVPSTGWTTFEGFAVDKNYGAGAASAGPSFVVWRIQNRYVVPCVASGTPAPALDPSPGPGIDELLEALANQDGISAGPLTPVTVDGYSGKFVELTVTKDIATCQDGFFPWLDKFVQANNEVLRVYALDVDGFRLTFFLRIPAISTPADRALLESIVTSVDITPR